MFIPEITNSLNLKKPTFEIAELSISRKYYIDDLKFSKKNI